MERAGKSKRESADERRYGITPKEVSELTYERSAYNAAYAKSTENRLNVDPLTGAYSRTFLEYKLGEALKQIKNDYVEHRKTQEQSHTVSILFSDLDNFKNVNDTKGHEVGNEVLKRAAEILARSVRSNDVVARLGGDEFVVLLPGTDEKGAITAKEHIVAAFQSDPMLSELGVTISIGSYSADASSDADTKKILEVADQRMYEDKRARKLNK